MKSFCTSLLIISLLTAAALAQPSPDTLWTRTCGGSGLDEAFSVQQTADGGYVVAGATRSFGAGGTDFYLVRMNGQGDTLWTHTYGGSGDDGAFSVQQTADGGYIVAGYSASFGVGGADLYLVKTNPLGDTLWTRTIGGSDHDFASCVRQTADGGYIVAGNTSSFGVEGADFYLVRTNGQGDTIWTRTYGGSVWDAAQSVQQTADGGYAVVGYANSFGAGNYDFYFVKTNSQGGPLWMRIYGGSDNDFALSLQQTEDGGYVMGGYTYSFGAGSADFYLVRIAGRGDTLWTHTYGGSQYDEAYCVQQTDDGGYVMGGYTYSFGAGQEDFYLVKANGSGQQLWARTYGGSGYEEAFSVQQTADGGFIMAGATESFGAGGFDFYIVKTGPETSETELISHSVPGQYTLYPAFPNPFNPSTQITFALPKASEISLVTFNLLGQKVATLAHGMQSAGTHAVTFDGSDFPSGIYFYRLQAGNSIQTQKMLLLK